MTNPPILSQAPVPALRPPNWQVSRVHASSGHGLDCTKMAEFLNNGWQFMGIQTGQDGLDSYAFFCRDQNK